MPGSCLNNGVYLGVDHSQSLLVFPFVTHLYHIQLGTDRRKGALAAPRQPDDVNPQKKSDMSQFFIVQGKVYRETR